MGSNLLCEGMSVNKRNELVYRIVIAALMTALVTFWGFRLAAHIFRRNLGKPEDFRYANMRKKWGVLAKLSNITKKPCS